MDSFTSDDEEYRFFDASENIASISDSDCEYGVYGEFQYDVWIRRPESVHERRSKFFKKMGSNLESSDFVQEIDRIVESSGAVLRNPIFEEEFSSSQSSSDGILGGNFVCRNGNFDVDENRVLGEEQLVIDEEYENTSTLTVSPSVQKFVDREIQVAKNMSRTINRMKSRWLSKLRSMACIVNGQVRFDNLGPNYEPVGPNPNKLSRVQRVGVRHCKKRLKELSALFKGQDIRAHEGSILTMKFSLDGQYIASAGEDGVVRVWQIVEDERSNEIDVPDIDPSCMYFTVNQQSELAPLVTEREKMSKMKSMTKTPDSACVIFPPKVFRILEKPLHEFRGHSGDILDLSWSKNNCLLSSSVDKTVRLWRVGCDQCLKVFSHSNYVTCVQFNPVDDNYFVSGSIDGKVRIWVIDGSHVVDWTDITDIVTAVCYHPDGQGGIIGSMEGNCRFFSISDNHFQLEDSLCLNSKKKSPCRRITGFEFFPQDPSKVLVTCADSQVRILHGVNVIGKYKGPRNAGNHTSAFFTEDGKHIVSACEDSNIYVWNCINGEESSLSQPKTIKSFECFSSSASVAIPWSGLKSRNSDNRLRLHTLDENSSNALPFTLGPEFFLESIPKGSATWPEEKLPSSPRAMPSPMRKSQYKFIKSSYQSSSSSQMWGLVIVTAGWDGRIRSFHNYGLPIPL